MRHTVKPKTIHDSPRGAKKLGMCAICGPESPLTLVLGRWVCAEGERLKQAEKGIRKANKAGPQQLAARLRAKIDRIAGQVVRSAGRCEAEGQVLGNGKVYQCSARMECAHVLSRGHKAIRHHPRNLTCLCNIHHRYYTQHPAEWEKFVGEDRINWLYELRRDPDAEGQEYWLRYWQGELKKVEK